jgi:hypothetical protein
VSLDTLLADVETSASFALASSYGGYRTNLLLEDLTDGKAWIAFRYDGDELEPEHGGPARRGRPVAPVAADHVVDPLANARRGRLWTSDAGRPEPAALRSQPSWLDR